LHPFFQLLGPLLCACPVLAVACTLRSFMRSPRGHMCPMAVAQSGKAVHSISHNTCWVSASLRKVAGFTPRSAAKWLNADRTPSHSVQGQTEVLFEAPFGCAPDGGAAQAAGAVQKSRARSQFTGRLIGGAPSCRSRFFEPAF